MSIAGGMLALLTSCSCLEWIFLILAGKKDNHLNLGEFEFWHHPNTDYGVSCHKASENRCSIDGHSSTSIFDWIFFILAGNEDNHKLAALERQE